MMVSQAYAGRNLLQLVPCVTGSEQQILMNQCSCLHYCSHRQEYRILEKRRSIQVVKGFLYELKLTARFVRVTAIGYINCRYSAELSCVSHHIAWIAAFVDISHCGGFMASSWRQAGVTVSSRHRGVGTDQRVGTDWRVGTEWEVGTNQEVGTDRWVGTD